MARRLGVGQLTDEVVQRVIRQWDEATGGVIGRLIQNPCSVSIAASTTAQPCGPLTPREALANLIARRGDEAVRQSQLLYDAFVGNRITSEQAKLLIGSNWSSKQLTRVLEAINQAPRGTDANDGFADLIDTITKQRSRVGGWPYELVRAKDNVDAGGTLLAYGKTRSATIPKLVGLRQVTKTDPDGTVRTIFRPILDTSQTTSLPLEGDSIYAGLAGEVWTDAKDKIVRGNDESVWKQILKARAAIEDSSAPVEQFRFEAAFEIDQSFRDWVLDPANWANGNPYLSDGAPKIVFFENLGDSVIQAK